MNTAVPMVWRMGPKYGLQESSRDPSPGFRPPRLTPSDRLRSGDGRTARMGPAPGRPTCSRPRRPLPSRSLACAVSFGCLSFQCFPFLVCTSCRGREATPPVDAAWLASNGSNPATFTADGLYLPGFRPNSLIGFGVRLMGMVVFVSFNVHAKSVYSNIFSVFTKVFE